MYSIRMVNGDDDEFAEVLSDLHVRTFFDSAPVPRFEAGVWWLVCSRREAVGFAGVVPSRHEARSGYLSRIGVLQPHRGQGLQLRLMRAVEGHARRAGWRSIVSDTTDNLASANNFISAGYRLFDPRTRWSWANSLYWRKLLAGQHRR
jgi:GNAT superfamily N-acetyltransferase